MEDPIGASGSERRQLKKEGVADAINRLLENLVIKCSKPEVRDYFEIGVIGYGATVGPAFGDELKGIELVKISKIADTAREEERSNPVPDGAGGTVTQTDTFQTWFAPVSGGNTPMRAALTLVEGILARWVSAHMASYPPIVVNITDGECTDGNPEPAAERVRALKTDDGEVLLFNCHISSASGSSVLFPNTEEGLPDESARGLFRMSSALPDAMLMAAPNYGLKVKDGARGFAFQADLVALISFLNIGTQTLTKDLR